MCSNTSADFKSPQSLAALSIWSRLVLAALTGLMLCLPCLDPRLFMLTWIGFIPLLLALQGVSLRQAYLLGAISGTVLWVGVSYWMIDFIQIFKRYDFAHSTLLATLFWLYAGQSFGLIALAWQWLGRGRLPAALTIPVVFVAISTLYPVVFDFRLSESQSQFLLAIQGTDLVGAQGMDLVILAVNVMVFQLCLGALHRRFAWHQLGGLILLLALWLGYGVERLQSWEAVLSEAQTRRIGLVQPNDAVSIEIPKPAVGYSRESPPELEVSERLVKAGAEILIWPEARFKGYFYQRSVREAYQQRIADLGVPLIFHDIEVEGQGEARRYYNSAVGLDGAGEHIGTYRKMKRMPFGEYLPAVLKVPLLQTFLGQFLREISAGTSHDIFTLAGMRLTPKICYESSDPPLMADAIGGDGRGKVLLVLSQDGWFGPGLQPFQHLYGSGLRAVENRVPLVHLINNGPSGVVLPTGRMLYQTPAFQAVETVVDVPFDPTQGGSFYSRHPRLVAWGSVLLLSLLILFHMSNRRLWKSVDRAPRPVV